jgi:hypothetical protein
VDWFKFGYIVLMLLESGLGHRFGALEGVESPYSIAIKDFLYAVRFQFRSKSLTVNQYFAVLP